MIILSRQSYRAHGIETLWHWQEQVIATEGFLAGQTSLLYSTPTSSGKSLIAEIVSLLIAVRNRQLIIWVAPYVSICAEKYQFLQKVVFFFMYMYGLSK